jgi:hypothetical protein
MIGEPSLLGSPTEVIMRHSRKRSAIVLALLFCSFLSSAFAELSVTNGNVGGFLTVRGKRLVISMEEPNSAWIYKAAKLNRVGIPSNVAGELIKKYGMPPQIGDKWMLTDATSQADLPDLQYREANGKYASTAIDYGGPPRVTDQEDNNQMRAISVVKAFLDDLGCEYYEWPFYAVMYDYQENGSLNYPVRSQSDYLMGRGALAENYARLEKLNMPSVVVVVRFIFEQMAFGTRVSWTEGTNPLGNGNPTPYAKFMVYPDGKLAVVYINYYFEVSAVRDDPRPILSWRELLESNAFVENFPPSWDDNQYTITGMELVLFVNDKNVTFPAWRVDFDYIHKGMMLDSPGLPDSVYHFSTALVFNAYTGELI